MLFPLDRTSIFSPVSPLDETSMRSRSFRHSTLTAISDDSRGRPSTPEPMPAAHTNPRTYYGRRQELSGLSRSHSPTRRAATPPAGGRTSPRRADPPTPLAIPQAAVPARRPVELRRPSSSNSARLAQPFTPGIPELAILSASTPGFPEKQYPMSVSTPARKEPLRWHNHISKLSVVSFVRFLFRFGALGVTATLVALCVHSLSIYGARDKANSAEATAQFLEAEENHNGVTWPQGVSLAPVYLAMGVAFAHFCASFSLTVLSCRNLFINPLSWSNFLRIWVDGLFVLAWIATVVVFRVLEQDQTPGTLGGAACKAFKSHPKDAFETVCNEQNAVFPLGVVAMGLEVAVLGSLALGSFIDHRRPPPYTDSSPWQQLA